MRRGVVFLALALAGCAQQSSASTPPVTSTPPAATPPAAATSSAAPAVTTAAYAGPALVDRVRWTSNSKGRALHVYPTAAGRTANGASARATAWQEVLRASDPADTASLHDQFGCHWDFARIVDPHKTSWDLEAWRPDVGYAATVAAQCNPGGAE